MRGCRLGGRLERSLLALGGVRVHGAGAPRIGGTINAGFVGAPRRIHRRRPRTRRVAASTVAVCTAGSVQPSPVLLALGLSPADACSAVHFSLSRATTAAEIDAALERLPPIVARARSRADAV